MMKIKMGSTEWVYRKGDIFQVTEAVAALKCPQKQQRRNNW